MNSRRPPSPRAAAPARPRASTPRPAASRPGSRPSPKGSTRPGSRNQHLAEPAARPGIEFTRGGETYSISWRALILTLVFAVAFVLISPTLSLYMRQQAEERALNEQVAVTEARIAQLEGEIARWEDPAYVQAQARERLGYVMPGQQPYVVVDPEVVIGEDAQQKYEESQTQLPPALQGPWYVELADSIRIAGGTRLVDDEAEDTTPGDVITP